jgi:hypothetical protein
MVVVEEKVLVVVQLSSGSQIWILRCDLFLLTAKEREKKAGHIQRQAQCSRGEIPWGR